MDNRANQLFWLSAFIFIISFSVAARAKSLYVISDIYPSLLYSYKIKDSNLIYQTRYYCESYAPIAAISVGLALDESEYGYFLFVTFEFAKFIEIIDAKAMSFVSSVNIYGASSLTGIVADEGRSKIYAMDRYTNHLYSYSWIPSLRALIPDYSSYIELQGMENVNPKGAFGIALDEIHGLMYVGDRTNKIKYYHTNNWSKAGEINVTCDVIGLALDVNRQYLYYGSMKLYGENDAKLYRYNLSTGIEDHNFVGSTICGISVNKDTGYVYITTWEDGNSLSLNHLIVYDSNLTKQSWESYNIDNTIDNPAGLCVPSGNAQYKPPVIYCSTAILRVKPVDGVDRCLLVEWLCGV